MHQNRSGGVSRSLLDSSKITYKWKNMDMSLDSLGPARPLAWESASRALRQPVPEAGVAAFLPLWRADRGALLRRMLAEGLEIVFCA